MLRYRTLHIGIVAVATASVALLRPTLSQAQRTAPTSEADAQYAEWVATYGRWTPAQAEKAGYLPTDVCVTATAVGLPADTGSMGRHFVHPGYIEDGRADADAPDIVLFDADDRAVGLEFEILTVVDPIPSVAGVPLERTPADPGVDQEHLSLHVYFVGDPGDRYKTFNPAVACGAGSESTDAGAAAGDATRPDPGARSDVPAAMPVAAAPGAGSVPGASTGAGAAKSMTETVALAPALAAMSTVADAPSGAPAVASAVAASSGGSVSSASSAVASSSVAPIDPNTMPVAGAGDWLPGGEASLLGALAGVLVLFAAAGWWTAMRRA